MDRTTLIVLLAVGAVLFVVWRRTEVQLVNAQNQAAKTAAGNALVGQGIAIVRSYYGV